MNRAVAEGMAQLLLCFCFMRVSRVRLLLLIIGLSGLIFTALQFASGERKASASAGESLLDHLRPDRARPTLAVPAGTRLHVRLKDRITQRNRAGDIFIAKLDGEVEQSGKVLAPRGSPVIGRITRLGEDAKRSSSTQVSLVLEQMVVGKKVLTLDSLALTLSTPSSLPGSSSSLHMPGLLGDEELVLEPRASKEEETIYEPDTRLTFVLAERLQLPVYEPKNLE